MAEQEEDTEEVVLTTWGKIKQYVEIALATKKVAMFVWSLIIGTGGTVLYGEVTDTKPLHDAAVSVGIVEPPFTPAGFVEHEHDWSHTHPELEHDHNHQHEQAPAAPQEPHSHADHIHADHEHPEYDRPVEANTDALRGTIAEEIKQALPENHDNLH